MLGSLANHDGDFNAGACLTWLSFQIDRRTEQIYMIAILKGKI